MATIGEMMSPNSSRNSFARQTSTTNEIHQTNEIQKKAKVVFDVEELFRTKTIDEINAVQQDVRHEIEKRKESLRQMVGERYRDLINAADTIKEMNSASSKISNCIAELETLSGHFGRQNTSQMKKSGSSETQNRFYSLATQMELLVDTPEKIWKALDEGHHLTSAQLFLLAEYIVNESLNINSNNVTSERHIFHSFPILHHQWAAISHFKPSILKSSRSSLKDIRLTNQKVSESLCAIILLDGSTPRKLLTEFLLARKAAINDVFHPSQHDVSIKRQLCDATLIIKQTLCQVDQIFFHEGSESLLKICLSGIVDPSSTDSNEALQWLFGEDFDVLAVARHLPPGVLKYHPKLTTTSLHVVTSTIESSTSEWLKTCIQNTRVELQRMLSYVSSISALASIRDAVHSVLSFSPSSDDITENDEKMVLPWKQSCQRVCGHPVSIWNEIFKDAFLTRTLAVFSSMFATVSESTCDAIANALASLEETLMNQDGHCHGDTSGFLWKQLVIDDLPKMTWDRTKKANATLDNASALHLKANGCTPAVKRICLDLHKRLASLWKEAQLLLNDTSPHDTSSTKVTPAFNKFSDRKTIEAALVHNCTSMIESLVCCINEYLTSIKGYLSSKQSFEKQQKTTIETARLTFLGHLCSAFRLDHRSLEKILSLGSKIEPNNLHFKRTSARSTLINNKNHTILQQNLSAIEGCKSNAFRIWLLWIADMFKFSLNHVISSTDLVPLLCMPASENVVIEEEMRESNVSVPSQLSTMFSLMLFMVCDELHRGGSHTLTEASLASFTLQLATRVVDTFEHWLCSKTSKSVLNQAVALQFIFDLKFVTQLLVGHVDNRKEESVKAKQRLANIVSQFEESVDPFDLEVFTPYISKFVNRQLQRSWLLFGPLACIDHQTSSASQRTSASPQHFHQEAHSVVPMTHNPLRLTPLPLGNHRKNIVEDRTSNFTSINTIQRSGSMFSFLAVCDSLI